MDNMQEYVINGNTWKLTEQEARTVSLVERLERDNGPYYQSTASGYGSKLKTPYMAICKDKRKRRVYAICYSNVGTCYIIINGRKEIVSDFLLDVLQGS